MWKLLSKKTVNCLQRRQIYENNRAYKILRFIEKRPFLLGDIHVLNPQNLLNKKIMCEFLSGRQIASFCLLGKEHKHRFYPTPCNKFEHLPSSFQTVERVQSFTPDTSLLISAKRTIFLEISTKRQITSLFFSKQLDKGWLSGVKPSNFSKFFGVKTTHTQKKTISQFLKKLPSLVI